MYHLMMKGINGQTIFEEAEDAIVFLQTLKFYKKVSGYKIYAYCLMGNHIHLLIKEEDEKLETVMRRIGASFVRWYNSKYGRSGHLFQDRFKSEVVEDVRYLLNVLRYIHHNPVQAGLVKGIGDYRWSSYSEYTHQCEIVDREFILTMFHSNREIAVELFCEFHQRRSEGTFLEIKERKRLTDPEAAEIVKRVCRVAHCADLQKIKEKETRNQLLRTLKSHGLSTRQIARLTGISRGVVLKA